MKRMAIAVSVAVLVFAVTVWAQTPAQTKSMSTEQELIKLENEWGDAQIKRDVAFFERILAEDYLYTDAESNIWTKAQFLPMVKSEEVVISSWVVENPKVRIYGDAAVVMGHTTIKSQYKGQDTSGKYQWTDVWVKHAGHWRCVASHETSIPQK